MSSSGTRSLCLPQVKHSKPLWMYNFDAINKLKRLRSLRGLRTFSLPHHAGEKNQSESEWWATHTKCMQRIPVIFFTCVHNKVHSATSHKVSKVLMLPIALAFGFLSYQNERSGHYSSIAYS